MVFATSFFTLALLVLPSFAASTHRIRIKRATEPSDGKHLVLLRDDVPLAEVVKTLSSSSNVTSQWDIINGFAGYLIPKDLEALMAHPGVLNIHENGVVSAMDMLTQYIAFSYPSPGRVDTRAM